MLRNCSSVCREEAGQSSEELWSARCDVPVLPVIPHVQSASFGCCLAVALFHLNFIHYDGIKQKMTFTCKDLYLVKYYTKVVNNYFEEEHKWYKEKESWGHL